MPKNKDRLGKLRPRYRFALNPFPEVRWSRCPRCEQLTFNRKFPLLILVKGHAGLVLGKTCRYCAKCEFIVCHQHELEAELEHAFRQRDPAAIGSEYHVAAVVERKVWARAQTEPLSSREMLDHAADIKSYYTLHDPRPRWMPADTPA
jgi:hypothetical protein